MPLQILFMIGFAIAIMINYPNLEVQKERITAHAGNVLAVVSLVFAKRRIHRHFIRYKNGRCNG